MGEDGYLLGVRRWLDDKGFPLEFKVAREFRLAGFWTDQGRHYLDLDARSKPRETDVIAALYREDAEPDKASRSVSVVAECKMSRDNPWVLFGGRKRHTLNLRSRVTEVNNAQYLDVLNYLETWPEVAGSPLVKSTGRFVAHGGKVGPHQTKKGNRANPKKGRPTKDEEHECDAEADEECTCTVENGPDSAMDDLFAAMSSVTKAAIWWANHRGSESPDYGTRPVHLVLPAIVVDARLFGVEMPDDAEDLTVERLDSPQLLNFTRRIEGRRNTLIDVVPVDALPTYIEQVRQLADALFSRD